ncbi:beta-agarase [Dyella tabacisoli]|uniref:Beta-agarase n=1 Tax=Dyella tabacisoli TaxID=2282381 RepID=A0A369UJM3_9GAMM|nr:beta-agarase [Dyella tabacisoli]RDD80315.1 beta-agarase [Dyella tabacisoli]
MKRIAFLSLLGLLGLTACQAATETVVADLSQITPNPQLTLQHVQRGAAPEPVQGATPLLRYTFEPAAQPQLVMAPKQGAWDWSRQGELRLIVQNAMPWAVTLTVDIDGVGDAQHLHATMGLPAGPVQTIVVPLQATSPRVQGMQVGPPMPFDEQGQRVLLATTVEGTLDPRQVRAVRIGMPAPQAAQALLLGRVETSAGSATLNHAYAGIVDAWGQYTRGSWPEKVDSDAVLRAEQGKAQAGLAAARKQQNPADPYGGRLDVPAFKANGWFRTERRDGRWQFVTPDGHAFFSLGVNAVTAEGGRSYVEGRESMFRELPSASGAWASFYGSDDSRQPGAGSRAGIAYNHGRWFDFYAANLYRADGSHALDVWRTRTLDRLQAWGFNTVGNWSDTALGKAHRMPYTRSIAVAGVFGNVSSGYDYWGRMPDPFDPRFAQAADSAVAKVANEVRDDPWLLGYFADNELAWAGQGPQGRWGLATGTLRGEAISDAKQAFIGVLKKKYGEPAKLAAAWGIALPSWEALSATGFAAPDPNEAHPAIADDYSAWLRQYADTYFRVVAEAIHRHDAHHLFLGGRFAVNTPEAVAACAAYCDVVSFNTYTDVPQHGFDAPALAGLGKPALITEFHFGSNDRGPFGSGVIAVYNEQQRGEAYTRFIAAAANDPNIVGAHWFQYADQPVTGRLLDGENAHIGLVGITDLPFTDFVHAVREANERVRFRFRAQP